MTFIGHTGEPRAVVKMFDIPVVTWVIYVYGNVSTMGRILYIYLCTHKIKSIGQKISTIIYNVVGTWASHVRVFIRLPRDPQNLRAVNI